MLGEGEGELSIAVLITRREEGGGGGGGGGFAGNLWGTTERWHRARVNFSVGSDIVWS